MLSKLLSKIRDRDSERQQEVSTTFAELVSDVVDAESSGLADAINENTVLERLEELGKSADEFEAVVEYVTVHRRYVELVDAASLSHRLKAVSLDEPAVVIRESTEVLRRCIKELEQMIKLPKAESLLKELNTRLVKNEEAFKRAEEDFVETRKELAELMSQANGVISRCDNASRRLTKIGQATTSRERKLIQRRQEFLAPSGQGYGGNPARIQKEITRIDKAIADERDSLIESASATDEHAAVHREYVELARLVRLPHRVKAASPDETDTVIRARTDLFRQCITQLKQMRNLPETEARLEKLETHLQEMHQGRGYDQSGDARFQVARLKQEIEQTKTAISHCKSAAARLEELTATVRDLEPTSLETDEQLKSQP
jgi:hypothetical protein